jgi:hypothetical protein
MFVTEVVGENEPLIGFSANLASMRPIHIRRHTIHCAFKKSNYCYMFRLVLRHPQAVRHCTVRLESRCAPRLRYVDLVVTVFS